MNYAGKTIDEARLEANAEGKGTLLLELAYPGKKTARAIAFLSPELVAQYADDYPGLVRMATAQLPEALAEILGEGWPDAPPDDEPRT